MLKMYLKIIIPQISIRTVNMKHKNKRNMLILCSFRQWRRLVGISGIQSLGLLTINCNTEEIDSKSKRSKDRR